MREGFELTQRTAVVCCAALLALVASTPALLAAGRRDAGEHQLSRRSFDPRPRAARSVAGLQAMWRASALLSAPSRDTPRASACPGDACQAPRVQIPGQVSAIRGSRTEAILAALSRSHFEPVSRAARFVADRNLRIDFYPASGSLPERGWGHLVVSLRWRFGASDTPD